MIRSALHGCPACYCMHDSTLLKYKSESETLHGHELHTLNTRGLALHRWICSTGTSSLLRLENVVQQPGVLGLCCQILFGYETLCWCRDCFCEVLQDNRCRHVCWWLSQFTWLKWSVLFKIRFESNTIITWTSWLLWMVRHVILFLALLFLCCCLRHHTEMCLFTSGFGVSS